MRYRRGLWLAGFVFSLAPHAVDASSCVRPVTQKIAFEKGAVCWNYSGTATHFKGRFSAGQKLTVKMSGELLEYNERTKAIETKWAARTPSVDGPQDFHAEGDFGQDSGTLEVTVPKTGLYQFGFYPCAMWHNPGQVQICASALPPKPTSISQTRQVSASPISAR